MGRVLLMNPSPKTNLVTKGENMAKTKHLKLGKHVFIGDRLAGSMYKNPYPTYMGSGSPSLWRNPGLALKRSFVHPLTLDNLYNFIGAGAGAIGTYAIPTGKLVNLIPVVGKYQVVRLLVGNIVNMSALATAANLAFKNKPGIARNVMVGGGALTIMQLVAMLAAKLPNVTVMQKFSPVTALAGLGANEDALRAKIEEAVKRELGQPESVSMVKTVAGRPEAVTSFRTVSQPASVSSYGTVGEGDGLTDDDLN